MLYLLIEAGHELCAVINKPRTILDAKSINIDYSRFPYGSVEADVLQVLKGACDISPKRLMSIKQLTSKRGWWVDAYLSALDQLPENLTEYLIYTNTPFSWKLVKALKKRGARVFFDSMDNMITYPHFLSSEKRAAKEGYGELLTFADFACANSQRTVDFFNAMFGKSVELVKNGVFLPRSIDSSGIEQVKVIESAKAAYKCCAGFIGKFGLRIDHRFIGELADANPSCLFVFIGLELEGQCEEFNKVVLDHPNILKLPSLPSAYVYGVLDEFDALMIPYSVGDNENSGDPLKLYQYFMTGKPIACTPIREVGEYANHVLISDDAREWSMLLATLPAESQDYSEILESISWQKRAASLLNSISGRG